MNVLPRARASDVLSWWLIAAMGVASILAGHAMGFRISPTEAILPTLGLLVLWSAMTIGRAQDRPRLAAGATAFLQMTLFTIIGVVLAYVVAARDAPLWDPAFAAADRALGLDWPAVLRAADAAPVSLWIGAIAYHSLTAQMVVCIVVLSATRRYDRLRLAVLAAIGSGIVTIATSGVMPAMGNVFDPAGYRHLWPSIAWLERGLIAGLRDGSLRVLDLGRLMGIVSFPSYHATLAVILAWAQRDVRGLRVAAPAWAGVTILATPLFGGHYAVDVLAGVALACAAIALAPRLIDRPRSAVTAGCAPARSMLHADAGPRDAAAAARAPIEEIAVVHGLV